MEKMNESDAIKIIKKYSDLSQERNESRLLEAAISALEKQIPKKPVREERSGMGYVYKDYYCSCGKLLGREPEIDSFLRNNEDIPWKYCANCGQRLDWESGEHNA